MANQTNSSFAYSIQTGGQFEPWIGREWLLTNGLGGFASSTIIGCNTRRYHGLLVAALNPPVGRLMTLNRIGEILLLDGREQPMHELSVNIFRGAIHPRGEQYLRSFAIDDIIARWEYDVDGVRVVKEVQLAHKRNIVGIRYTFAADKRRQIEMRALPFISMRDFHALRKGSCPFHVAEQGGEIIAKEGEHSLFMRANADFNAQEDWWRGHIYPVETERGQDDSEDLYTPGYFRFSSQTGEGSLTLWAGTQSAAGMDWNEELSRWPKRASPGATPGVKRLARAAVDFVAVRNQSDGSPGSTIIAGYPWFSDWGRDTMIALPGLLLKTGRLEEAAQVLCVFAQYVSGGMIPNVFNDYTNQPEYNTVDASLWFIHACHEYARLGGDRRIFAEKLLPACRAILEGYRDGTRFNIHMDPGDGLISCGDPQTQLTWMDAKCGGVAFTPRHGKPVEINALWFHVLTLMGEDELAAKTGENLIKKFWHNPFRGLYDVIDVDRRDASLRPNQIFAVSLAHSALNRDQQIAVVEAVRRELLTPMGLRTLACSDPGYRGRYTGAQMERDAAYHNGTVWAWLMGPFIEAYLRVYDRSAEAVQQARQWMSPLIDSMAEGRTCVGQIGEIFEGDSPHRPVGAFAQAWSVAEMLRMAVELGM